MFIQTDNLKKKVMPTGGIEQEYKKKFRCAVSDSGESNWAI